MWQLGNTILRSAEAAELIDKPQLLPLGIYNQCLFKATCPSDCSQVWYCVGTHRKQDSPGGHLWLEDSIGLAKSFLGLHRSLRPFLPKSPSSSLSFPRCQTSPVDCSLSLYSPASSPLPFTQVSLIKSLVHQLFPWLLLLREPEHGKFVQ